MTGEVEKWHRRLGELVVMVSGGEGGYIRWLVCLAWFILLRQLSQASVHPAETERDESVRTARRPGRGKVKWAPAGTVRGNAGRGWGLEKIAWAELQDEFLMPHLLFIGSSGLSFAACQRGTYNQTSGFKGIPLWVLFWNSLIQLSAIKVNVNSAPLQKIQTGFFLSWQHKDSWYGVILEKPFQVLFPQTLFSIFYVHFLYVNLVLKKLCLSSLSESQLGELY